MKVTELKKMLDGKSDEILKKSITELYKLIPNSKKEYADSILNDVISGNRKKVIKVDKGIDFNTLSEEVNEFIENAYNDNYFMPNRVIPKNQRSKWRFLVKRYINELCKISYDNEHYNDAVKLLVKLYDLMCYACYYHVFVSDDAFESIGVSQATFYQVIAERVLANGYTEENIASLIVYASSGGLSRESLHEDQQMLLLSLLKTKEQQKLALNIAKQILDQLKGREVQEKYEIHNYTYDRNVDEFCDFVLMCHLKLKEYDDGIKYYFENYEKHYEEITLYCALKIVDLFKNKNDVWLQYYEYGINEKKIEPRDSLVEKYKELKKKLKH